MGFGDCLSQVAVEKKTLAEYNFMRTIRFASFGLVLAVRLFYYFLSWHLIYRQISEIGSCPYSMVSDT